MDNPNDTLIYKPCVFPPKMENALLAIDGSDITVKVVDMGIDLARHFDMQLHVLHVIEPYSIPSDLPPYEEMYDYLLKKSNEIVEQVVEYAEEKGITVLKNVLEGEPAKRIIEFIEENSIDLIVMGTLGKSRLEKIFVGSVTDKVLKLSPVSVMVIK